MSSNHARKATGGDSRWDEMFNQLVEFKRNHGHCLVPNRCHENPSLGSWVSTQRRQRKKRIAGLSPPTRVTEERDNKLNAIGFVWTTKDPRHVPWEVRYRELCGYKEKFGDCLVPIGFEENVSLSNWVSTQRQEMKLLKEGRSSRLNKDRVEALEKIGFVWEAQRKGRKRNRDQETMVASSQVVAQAPSTNSSRFLLPPGRKSTYSESLSSTGVPQANLVGFVTPPCKMNQSIQEHERNRITQTYDIIALALLKSKTEAESLSVNADITRSQQNVPEAILDRSFKQQQMWLGKCPILIDAPSTGELSLNIFGDTVLSQPSLPLLSQISTFPQTTISARAHIFDQSRSFSQGSVEKNEQAATLASIQSRCGTMPMPYHLRDGELDKAGKKTRINSSDDAFATTDRFGASVESSRASSTRFGEVSDPKQGTIQNMKGLQNEFPGKKHIGTILSPNYPKSPCLKSSFAGPLSTDAAQSGHRDNLKNTGKIIPDAKGVAPTSSHGHGDQSVLNSTLGAESEENGIFSDAEEDA